MFHAETRHPGSNTMNMDGEMEVTAIRFEDGILSYEYAAFGSQVNWGKGSVARLSVWLQVRGDSFRGALSLDVPPEGDYAVEGRRRTADP